MNDNIIKSEHFEKCESNEQNIHSDKKTGAIIKSISNKNKKQEQKDGIQK